MPVRSRFHWLVAALLFAAAAAQAQTPPRSDAGNPVPAAAGNSAAPVAPGPGPYTAVQLTQAFQAADANRDGLLSRVEARRLTITSASFDDMDRDKDGSVSRSEYEDSFR